MTASYPEVLPWNPLGLPYAHESRRQVDAASPAYQRFAMRIAEKWHGIMEMIIGWGWQLDNEIGAHTHFVSCSPQSNTVSRMAEKYGTTDALNEAG